MNPAWYAVAISAVGLWPALYAFRSAWRTRATDKGNVVFQNALELAQANREEANSVRKKLIQANNTIDTLAEKLQMANRQIIQLSSDLYDANTELSSLRAQVKTMSQQVNGED